MLIIKIKNDATEARKGANNIEKNLLVTLYSEAQRVGKDGGNRDTTDKEVVQVVKKFAKGIEETLPYAKDNSKIEKLKEELTILGRYLPTQLTKEELEKAITAIIKDDGIERNPKAMGKIMGLLKAKFDSQYDGKVASEIVRNKLVIG